MQVPLWCAVAASNELPETDELDALYDRFLLKRAVPRVSDTSVAGFLRNSIWRPEPMQYRKQQVVVGKGSNDAARMIAMTPVM